MFVYLSAGAGCVCVCCYCFFLGGGHSLLICPQKGDRDLELWWHALLKQSSLTANKRSQTVSLPPDDFFLAFLVVQFRRGMKSFFLLRDILKALVSVALVRLLMLWMRHKSLSLFI